MQFTSLDCHLLSVGLVSSINISLQDVKECREMKISVIHNKKETKNLHVCIKNKKNGLSLLLAK